MTGAEIEERLGRERGFGSRYPARIIFAENLESYSELENRLRLICDDVVNAADFCNAPDAVPQFDRIAKTAKERAGRRILLLSVGEYLRLCFKRELDPERRRFKAFWETQQPADSETRIIIPMFACKDIFDRIVGEVDERQENFVWTLDSRAATGNYSVTVYSPEFKNAVTPDANNLAEWLRNWQDIFGKNLSPSVVTAQYKNVEPVFGTVNLKLVADPSGYLADVLEDGKSFVAHCRDKEFLRETVAFVSRRSTRKTTFEKIVLEALNVNEFDFVSIAARWETLNSFQKNLVWLWYKAYPGENYYGQACNAATEAAEIPAKIRDEIFSIANKSDERIEERMAAVRAFSFPTFDDAYFARMDKLPLDETKLKLLTCRTHEERAYAVKIVGRMLRDGAEPGAIATELLERDFPALASYLKDDFGCDADEYMAWYRKNKIMNRYPGECPVKISLERFETRHKLMQKFSGKDRAAFWIDGFGIEYAPLFLHELKARGIVPESAEAGLALLPTDTKHNRVWDEHDEKWDRLDSLSHGGTPDDKSYYSCIAGQLSVISDAAKKVEELLENHEYVIVTGDHGSSRFAALAFHSENVVPISAPKGSKVRNFGRFCELGDDDGDVLAVPDAVPITSNGKKFFVMENYRHFATGGNAAGGNTDDRDIAGEVHGGNTAEERLVPVIAIKRKQPLPPPTCKPKSPFVVKKHGRAETELTFSRPVSAIEVTFGGKKAGCARNEDGSWSVVLEGVAGEEIILSITADGRLLPDVKLKVKTRGISKNADPFDGMGL